jgi:hypothetical protein
MPRALLTFIAVLLQQQWFVVAPATLAVTIGSGCATHEVHAFCARERLSASSCARLHVFAAHQAEEATGSIQVVLRVHEVAAASAQVCRPAMSNVANVSVEIFDSESGTQRPAYVAACELEDNVACGGGDSSSSGEGGGGGGVSGIEPATRAFCERFRLPAENCRQLADAVRAQLRRRMQTVAPPCAVRASPTEPEEPAPPLLVDAVFELACRYHELPSTPKDSCPGGDGGGVDGGGGGDGDGDGDGRGGGSVDGGGGGDGDDNGGRVPTGKARSPPALPPLYGSPAERAPAAVLYANTLRLSPGHVGAMLNLGALFSAKGESSR